MVGIDAGLHVVLRLPDGLDDVAVAVTAEQLGVRTTPVSAQFAGDQGPRGLVCGYACLPESTAGEVATVIATAVRQVLAVDVTRASVTAWSLHPISPYEATPTVCVSPGS